MQSIMNRSAPTILIVDDDKDIQKTLSTILQSQGYDTASATSAREALEKTTTQFFDLVLLDINLPDKEGTRLLSDLEKITPKIIKIIITGYPSIKNATEALNSGADLYLTKPLDPDNLLKVIKSKLEEREEKERITRRKMIEWTQRRAREARLTDIQEFSEKTAHEFADFGLTRTQAKTYVALTALGAASALDIANLSGIRREEVYRTLPALEKCGLVTRRFGTPRRFLATKPDAALEILTKTRLDTIANETNGLEQKKDKLVSQLEKIVLRVDEEEPSIEALSQQDNVSMKLIDMTEKAKNQIAAAISSDQFWQTILERIRAREANGQLKVSVRMVTEETDVTGLTRAQKVSTYKRLDLRKVERLPFSLLMIDDKEAVWGEPHQQDENTQVLWTNRQTQVAVLKMAFENLWEKSHALS
jgi:DNA-binding response OmpR family regulator